MIQENVFLTFEARAAPKREVRMNEADGQLTRKGQFLQNEMPLNSKHIIFYYIFLLSSKEIFMGLFSKGLLSS